MAGSGEKLCKLFNQNEKQKHQVDIERLKTANLKLSNSAARALGSRDLRCGSLEPSVSTWLAVLWQRILCKRRENGRGAMFKLAHTKEAAWHAKRRWDAVGGFSPIEPGPLLKPCGAMWDTRAFPCS